MPHYEIVSYVLYEELRVVEAPTAEDALSRVIKTPNIVGTVLQRSGPSNGHGLYVDDDEELRPEEAQKIMAHPYLCQQVNNGCLESIKSYKEQTAVGPIEKMKYGQETHETET